MKLAEALLLRKEYQTNLENLTMRILANVKVQENTKPNEEPEQLLEEYMRVSDELCEIVKKINRANNEIKLPDGRTIAEAITERDNLKKKRGLLMAIIQTAITPDYRLTRTEIKMFVSVDIKETQKQIDDMSKQYRILDTEIQKLNWAADLEE